MSEGKTIQVRAKAAGYVNRRIRPGETFEIPESQFSERWMEKVEPAGSSGKQSGSKTGSSGKQSEQS